MYNVCRALEREREREEGREKRVHIKPITRNGISDHVWSEDINFAVANS